MPEAYIKKKSLIRSHDPPHEPILTADRVVYYNEKVYKRIEGCYHNVMDLPIQLVRELLLNVAINLWDYLKPF
jgi:predicted house-cleaning NTP pyrophosphatase (Maf/HAM1 superfamily)